eukprot:2327506-Amphidinium_carterae.1
MNTLGVSQNTIVKLDTTVAHGQETECAPPKVRYVTIICACLRWQQSRGTKKLPSPPHQTTEALWGFLVRYFILKISLLRTHSGPSQI